MMTSSSCPSFLSNPFLEDLTFRGSPEPTIGVELELQILDPESGDLSPGALQILDACEEEGIEGVSGEYLLTMLEIKTGVCPNVAGVKEALSSQLARLHRLVRGLGHDLAIGGTHPFHCDANPAIFPDPRYRRILNAQGLLPSPEAIFGLHIHIGAPDGERAIGLVNLLTPFLPHLLALSASSPFWQGIDTRFASSRARLFRPSAHAGIPLPFSSWRELCDYCAVLHEGGVLEGTKDLYWDIRPRPQLGTIELRIFDAPCSLSCLLGLAALTRCLVLDGLRLLEERPELMRADPRQFWLAQENRWLASRYGLQARCMRSPELGRRPLVEDVSALLERLLPTAIQHEEADFLDVFQPMDHFESGADRWRRLYRETGTWRAVLDDMWQGWSSVLSEGTVAARARTAFAGPDIVSSADSVPGAPVPQPGLAAPRDRERPWPVDPGLDSPGSRRIRPRS